MRVAVVGAGIVGLATARQLLVRGADVDCYEAETPMAARSTGDTRIFRLIHKDPALTALAVQAREAWREWSTAAGQTLVGSEGVLVSGEPAGDWCKATREAGVPVELTDEPPAACQLPARRPVGPFAYDPAGGVIDVRSAGAFLLEQLGHRVAKQSVSAVEVDGDRASVVTELGAAAYDAVVVAAGADTPRLATRVGLTLPDELVRHVRFTFRLEDSVAPPCWIEESAAWRPGFTSYSHRTRPGAWAIGASLPLADVAWDLGAEEVERRSQDAVTAYVSETLHGVDADPIDRVACDITLPGGDGFDATRIGPVVVVWGDNLFKFAPWLGERLAEASFTGDLPPELHQPPS
jgi:sarcosine oxidase